MGDADAYGELVSRHQDLAFRTAYLITRDAAAAEDVAQRAFVKGYYALPRFRAGAAFRPWILRIVANEARNDRVAAGRRATLALRATAEAAVTGGVSSPEHEAMAMERRAELLTAIGRLREEERLAVYYRYFMELNETEMSETLGWRRGTVKSRLARALTHLRDLVPRDDIDAGDGEA